MVKYAPVNAVSIVLLREGNYSAVVIQGNLLERRQILRPSCSIDKIGSACGKVARKGLLSQAQRLKAPDEENVTYSSEAGYQMWL